LPLFLGRAEGLKPATEGSTARRGARQSDEGAEECAACVARSPTAGRGDKERSATRPLLVGRSGATRMAPPATVAAWGEIRHATGKPPATFVFAGGLPVAYPLCSAVQICDSEAGDLAFALCPRYVRRVRVGENDGTTRAEAGATMVNSCNCGHALEMLMRARRIAIASSGASTRPRSCQSV